MFCVCVHCNRLQICDKNRLEVVNLIGFIMFIGWVFCLGWTARVARTMGIVEAMDLVNCLFNSLLGVLGLFFFGFRERMCCFCLV